MCNFVSHLQDELKAEKLKKSAQAEVQEGEMDGSRHQKARTKEAHDFAKAGVQEGDTNGSRGGGIQA